MKKIFLSLAFAVICTLATSAQKFALIDMEYILKNVPSYEMANEQLNQLSQRWQKEVEAVSKEAHRGAGEEARGGDCGQRETGHRAAI